MEPLINAAVSVLMPLYPALTPEKLKKALDNQGNAGRLLSAKEAASELGVCTATINKFVKEGKVRAIELCPRHEVQDKRGWKRFAGGRLGFPIEDINRLKNGVTKENAA